MDRSRTSNSKGRYRASWQSDGTLMRCPEEFVAYRAKGKRGWNRLRDNKRNSINGNPWRLPCGTLSRDVPEKNRN
jgi:hypothetical protein